MVDRSTELAGGHNSRIWHRRRDGDLSRPGGGPRRRPRSGGLVWTHSSIARRHSAGRTVRRRAWKGRRVEARALGCGRTGPASQTLLPEFRPSGRPWAGNRFRRRAAKRTWVGRDCEASVRFHVTPRPFWAVSASPRRRPGALEPWSPTKDHPHPVSSQSRPRLFPVSPPMPASSAAATSTTSRLLR